MHEHHDDIETALQSIGDRPWRSPEYSAFLKEVDFVNMNNAANTRRVGRLTLAVGALVLTGTSFAAGAYVGSTVQVKVVTADGKVYDAQMTPMPDGTYEGVTSDGARIRVAPAGDGATPSMPEGFRSRRVTPESGAAEQR